MKRLTSTELHSLASLLDADDDVSYALARQQILRVGEPILPYLEELRAGKDETLAARADSVARELRFKGLAREFRTLANALDPDLEKGALLIARFGYPEIKPHVYSAWLDRVAARVLDELPSDSDSGAALQRLNSYLFQAMGFAGNETNYYDPDNSYLNRVIDTRRGIPVSLSVLYLLLGKRLGLPVYGVAAPGHFLVGFQIGAHACFVDPYHRGRVLDLSEVRRLLMRSGYEFRKEFVAKASTRDILVRMMRNLIAIYDRTRQIDRAEMLAGLIEILLTRRPKSVE